MFWKDSHQRWLLHWDINMDFYGHIWTNLDFGSYIRVQHSYWGNLLSNGQSACYHLKSLCLFENLWLVCIIRFSSFSVLLGLVYLYLMVAFPGWSSSCLIAWDVSIVITRNTINIKWAIGMWTKKTCDLRGVAGYLCSTSLYVHWQR